MRIPLMFVLKLLKVQLLLTLAVATGRVAASDTDWERYATPQSMWLVGKTAFGRILTEADVRSMDTMCKHVLAYEIANNWSGPFYSDPSTFPLLNRPEFAMARGVNFMHHYCFGEVERFRYHREFGSDERARALEGWGSSIRYCINGLGNNHEWSFRHVLYAEMADYHLRSGQVIQALDLAQKSIELNKEYEPAYVVYSDALVRTSKKDDAIKILEQGLENAIQTKALVRRYFKLTGKQPPTKAKATNPMTGPQPLPSRPPQAEKEPDIPSPSKSSSQANFQSSGDSAEGAGAPASKAQPIGTARHCRFCPD